MAAVRVHDLQATGHAMIAMPLPCSHLAKSQARAPSMQPNCFQPLDPGIVDASIPAFFVGRNRDGFWVARDARGENGGIFLFRSSAIAFARRVSGSSGCATVFPSERFELEAKNQGNPLIGFLKPLLRLLMSASSRSANNET
jgi:hypothetical protein